MVFILNENIIIRPRAYHHNIIKNIYNINITANNTYETKRAVRSQTESAGLRYCTAIRVFSYGILAAIVSAARPPADTPAECKNRTT